MIEVKNLSCSFSEGAFTKNKFTAVSPISAIFKNGGRYTSLVEQNGEYARMWENYTKTTQWHIGNEVKVC